MDNYGQTEKAGPTIAARILAGLVLAVAAWFLFKVVLGIIAGIAWFVAVIVAIVAIVWALRTLF
jgi:hypothetical protein